MTIMCLPPDDYDMVFSSYHITGHEGASNQDEAPLEGNSEEASPGGNPDEDSPEECLLNEAGGNLEETHPNCSLEEVKPGAFWRRPHLLLIQI